MNTIPTIFNEQRTSYTAVGGIIGENSGVFDDLCVVVLNRGRRYYGSLFFDDLLQAGFTSIISAELSPHGSNIESLSGKYPAIKFLSAGKPVTAGEMINISFRETSAPYILVLWNDISIPHGSFTLRLLEKLKTENLLCTAPVLSNAKGAALPNQIVPTLQGNTFSTEQLACIKDKTETIYPYDFMGVYNRRKCMNIGGFDYGIQNPYWQNLDFGFRAHLWGEQIKIFTSFRLHYDGEAPTEDISADTSYRQFYLKNLAPELVGGEGYLSYYVYISFMCKSGLNPLTAWKYFFSAKKWVWNYRMHFKTTARNLTAQWEPFI